MLHETSLSSIIFDGSWVHQLVLAVLILMSSVSWAVMILKWVQLKKMNAENRAFSESFYKEGNLEKLETLSKEYSHSSYARLFNACYRELLQFLKQKQAQNGEHTASPSAYLTTRIERSIEFCSSQQHSQIEERLSLLATISSAAPFIGLFGTVLGIIDAFQQIGLEGVPSLAVVAPGISEALVATAAGLLAAIPALMAYNYYKQRSYECGTTLQRFSLELMNRMELASL